MLYFQILSSFEMTLLRHFSLPPSFEKPTLQIFHFDATLPLHFRFRVTQARFLRYRASPAAFTSHTMRPPG